jgi:membrane associated rhomboid family serine protease
VTEPPEEPAAEVDLRCYRHPDRDTGIRCVRCDRPICPDCMIPASVGFQCPECVSEGRRTVRTPRTIYGGRIRTGSRPDVVTMTLIGINVAVFLATTFTGMNLFSGNGNSTLFNHLALIPPAVAHGDWYRLFTAAFLHFEIFHIGFNMWALYVLGPPLEALLGRLRYLTLYLLSGLGGSILSLALGPLNETAAGASGAIFGLFGALYVLSRHRNLATGNIVVLIIANLLFTFAIPNIDWRGHVGGLITGTVVAVIFALAPQGPNRNRIQAAGVVAVMVVLAAAGGLGVHRVNSECRTAVTTGTPVGPAAFCAYYDSSE